MAIIESYRSFCKKNSTLLPLFYQPWYLDATCVEGTYHVAAVHNRNGDITGIWPYYQKSKLIHYVTLPPLTPYLGPWLLPNAAQHPVKRRTNTFRQLKALAEQLPTPILFRTHVHPDLVELLPLQQFGFKEIKRYTYRINLSPDLNPIDIYQDKTRNLIRKAQSNLSVSMSTDFDQFWTLNKQTFTRQGTTPPYSRQIFENLHKAIQQHSAGHIWLAKANDSQVQGAIYTVHDNHSAYLLAIGSDAFRREGGTISLLIHTAIRHYQDTHKVFDFEGSMMPNVERFFRRFGGTPTPYSALIRCPNRYIEALLQLTHKI